MIPELPADLSQVVEHVQSTYPHEGCGLLLRRESDGKWRVKPMRNAYDRYHAVDPVQFPRTSRTAYFFDPKQWLRVCEEAEREGERIACIFHSHIDVGAYFSQEDRAMAAPGGEPLLPGVCYLVLGVNSGAVRAARLFWWEESGFRERPVEISPK